MSRRLQAALILPLVFLICCVSRTLPEQRFRESAALSAPTLNITIGDPENFSFAVVGDLHVAGGDTSRLRKILDGAQAEGDAFIILLGDIVDQGTQNDVAAVTALIRDLGWQDKVIAILGNHDVFEGGWEYFKNAFGPSHFSFELGDSKFIVLDTADATLGDEQTRWLKSELALTRPKHLFLLSHYLPTIPDQRTYLKIADPDEAFSLMGLATKYQVTGWLGAHYHSYIQKKIGGVDYLVAGGGGGRRMAPYKGYFFAQVQVSPSGVSYYRRDFQ